MTLEEVLKEMREAAGVGLDGSPGDPRVAKWLRAIEDALREDQKVSWERFRRLEGSTSAQCDWVRSDGWCCALQIGHDGLHVAPTGTGRAVIFRQQP